MYNRTKVEAFDEHELIAVHVRRMHQAFKACIELETNGSEQLFTNDELVQHMIQSEWDDRQHRSIQRGLKNANFRYSASIEQLDYTGQRGLDKNMVQ